MSINKFLLISFLTFFGIFGVVEKSWALENLDEIFNRKARQTVNAWPNSSLEDSGNNYIWQSETLMYNDITTGHEVWRMSSTPNLINYYHNDIGVSPWSADGKRMSISSRRTTNAFSTDWWIWMVADSNGAKFRSLPGSASRLNDSINGYFHWSPQIPDVFYEVGRVWPYTANQLYKGQVSDNSCSSQLILTFPETIKLDKMISGDGRKLLVSSTNEAMIYPTSVYPNASIDDSNGYSIDRNLALYGTTPNPYAYAHDRYYAGDGSWYFIMPIGSSNRAWWKLKSAGSAVDGGAQCNNADFPVTDPNYDFGECWPVNADGGTNPDPFGSTYWSHFVPDRWGRFSLFSNSNSTVPPRGYGPGTWDIQNQSYPVYSYGGGAQHHDWHGFTDYVVSSRGASSDPNYLNDRIYSQKYNDIESQETVCYAHTRLNGGTAYNSLTRPGQSPDGTKVAWQSEFLNSGADKTDVFWSVVYYPYPPTDLSASYSSGIKVAWLPPKYTERGWPYASSNPQKDSLEWPLLDGNGNEIGEPLYAREIKQYHIWRATNQTGPWQEINVTNAQYSYTYSEDPDMFMLHPIVNNLKVSPSNKIYFTDNPGNGTFYYAITSEEHSGLESDGLSEIMRVIVSGTDVSTQIVQVKGQADFWTTSPSVPIGFSSSLQTAGQYNLSWTEPESNKIRYYNIYYSNSGNPSATQQYRIASVPVANGNYLDWLADQSSSGYYGITSVDRYGNESNIVLANSSDTTPPSAPQGLAVQ